MPRRERRSFVLVALGAVALMFALLAVPSSSPGPSPARTQSAVTPPEGSSAVAGRRPRVRRPGPQEPSPSPHPGLAVRTMLEDPSGHALDAFHAALRRAERGEGEARVLFYGASHTAADHFPGHIRKGLQERFGDGGRGFTMPMPPSALYDYWQWGATIEDGEGWTRVRLGLDRGVPDHYGIAGIYFDSEGREAMARVENAESGVGSRADTIEVLYQELPEGGDFIVSIDGEERERVSTDAPRVGAGRAVYEVEEGHHAVELRALAGAPVRLYGFVFERSGPGVVVDNVALTGARARYHHKWLEPIYSQHLELRAPDLLVLWYGGNEGNDYRYPADRTSWEIRRTVERLRAAAPEASCVIVGAADKPLEVDGEWTHRVRTDAINRASRTIAFANGCAFFDTVRFMGGPRSMVRWVEADPTLARGDYIHFSALGYRLLSENLLYELLVGYSPSPSDT